MKQTLGFGLIIVITCLSLLMPNVPVKAEVLPTSPEEVIPSRSFEPADSGPQNVVPSNSGKDLDNTSENIAGELGSYSADGGRIIVSLDTPDAGDPPNQPVSPDPADDAISVPVHTDNNNAVNLQVTVNDPDSPTLSVSFYGRTYCPTPNFTLAVIPDSQYYSASAGLLQYFDSQTQWIVDNLTPQNIVYTAHTGDLVDTNNTTQWANANEAMTRLETGSAPFGITLGNHDGAPDDTQNFNALFPYTRFEGRPYYGGHYDNNNDNSYGLFSSGGMDFIVLHIEWNNYPEPDPDLIDWADNLLQSVYPSRRAILVFHDLVASSNSLSPDAQIIYNHLKHNPNLFLMLGGHANPELKLTLNDAGHTVYALRADYSNRANGGNSWMRLLEFQPSANQIQVRTYSPYLDQYETDGDSQFPLAYTMGGAACDPFAPIGTLTEVASGSSPVINWTSRNFNTQYEWYVTVSDGSRTATGPLWSFTTEAPNAAGLVGFSAGSTPAGIQLDWESAQEIDLLGFNVYRGESLDGPQTMLNDALIPAHNPGQLMGSAYRYLDSTSETNRTYFYSIEWVGIESSEMYGPQFARLAHYSWLPAISR